MTFFEEVLGGLGEFSFEIENDPRFRDLHLERWFLRRYDGERHAYTGIVLDRPSFSERGIIFTGRSAEWLLGLDDSGPLVEDRRYVSGVSRLSNGDLSLGNVLWGTREDTGWAFASGAANMASAPTADDVLTHHEGFDDVLPGDTYEASVTAVVTSGRLRLRFVNEGSFVPPNLLDGVGWGDLPSNFALHPDGYLVITSSPKPVLLSEGFEGDFEDDWVGVFEEGGPASIFDRAVGAGTAHSGNVSLEISKCPQPQLIENGGFEAATPLEHWQSGDGYWDVTSEEARSGVTSLFREPATRATAVALYTVTYDVEEERYSFRCWVKSTAKIEDDDRDFMKLRIVARTEDIEETRRPRIIATVDDAHSDDWLEVTGDISFSEDDITVRVGVANVGNMDSQGTWYADDFELRQVSGNVEQIDRAAALAIDPEATYTTTFWVRSADIKSGVVRMVALLTGAGVDDETVESEGRERTRGQWREVTFDVQGKEGYASMLLGVQAEDVVGRGHFYVDDVLTVRSKGNVDLVEAAESVPVIPEVSHTVKAKVRAMAGLAGGTIKLRARFTAAGRDDVIVESSAMDDTKDAVKDLTFDVTPPSGYGECWVGVVATDVAGTFNVDDVEIRSTMTDKLYAESVAAGSTTVSTTVPTGTERVRLEVVAEAGFTGSVSDVSLRNTGATTTIAAAVAALLTDEHGAAKLTPGRIYGSEVIAYDFRARLRHNRELIKHFARSALGAVRRTFRTNPDLTFDFGADEEIFEHRDVLFTARSAVVLEEPNVASATEEQVTDVLVVGAERGSPKAGGRVTITGSASTTPTVKDAFGALMRRTKVVHDTSIEHVQHANDRAAFELAQQDVPRVGMTLHLSDVRGYGAFAVGDWIKAYFREAGIEGDSAETHEGEAVFPEEMRVTASKLRPGPSGHRYTLWRHGSEEIDVTELVRANPETTLAVELGDQPAEFVLDPAGGLAGLQLERLLRQRS